MKGGYQLNKGLCGSHRMYGHTGEEKISCPCRESNPRSSIPSSFRPYLPSYCCADMQNLWISHKDTMIRIIHVKQSHLNSAINKRPAFEPKCSGNSARSRSIVWWVLTHAPPPHTTITSPTLRSRRLQLLITKHNQTTLNENGMLGGTTCVINITVAALGPTVLWCCRYILLNCNTDSLTRRLGKNNRQCLSQ